MKIIDRTPFYNERGEISFSDRTRAILKYGKSWLSEMEAQKSVLPVFEKYLDRKFTLLRNVTHPGLEAFIPFILVGPAGVFVCYVTDLAGMYRAKGDQWGTISGNTLKPEKINLVTRTEQLAHVVQLYLQHEGRLEIPGVETILICTNPSTHVDSVRPIVRIVMRDALERFIISISETTPVLGQDMVINIVDLITNPIRKNSHGEPPVVEQVPVSVDNELPEESADTPTPAPSLDISPAEATLVSPVGTPQSGEFLGTGMTQHQANDSFSDMGSLVNPPIELAPVNPFLPQDDISSTLEQEPIALIDNPTPASTSWPAPAALSGEFDSPPGMIPLQSELSPEPYSSPLPESLFPGLAQTHVSLETQQPLPIKRKSVSGKQWIILAGMALILIILVSILLFFILKDFIL